MISPTQGLKPSNTGAPSATTPSNNSQPHSRRDGGNFREEAIVTALFQRLPKMLASLESFSEK
jgi:hypothetical protein